MPRAGATAGTDVRMDAVADGNDDVEDVIIGRFGRKIEISDFSHRIVFVQFSVGDSAAKCLLSHGSPRPGRQSLQRSQRPQPHH